MKADLWRGRIASLIFFAGALAARAEREGPYTYEIINDEAWITGFDWGYTGDLVITNRLGRYPVTTIGDWAFTRHYGLQRVTIPDSVRAIGAKAFGWCYGLYAVTIPDGLTTIGVGTFTWCTNLTHIVIGNKITAIGDGAFENCRSLSRIYFRGNAPSLGRGAFSGTPATVYYLPGTRGWGATYGDRLAVLWNPEFQNARVANNGLVVTVIGTANIPVALELSTDLVLWTRVLATNLTGGALSLIDSNWRNYTRHFYRMTGW